MDIGIWWRIVFPVFHWQYHSVLFEIAWCIMLYLVVLAVEFSHTVVESMGWHRVMGLLKKLTIIFVIFGIALSTLHQSSLGTLFLATPFRLHPLWYTDFLPLLFFLSAMALGCLTISFLTIIVYWLYGGKAPMKAIAGLGQVSAWLMVGYLGIKFIEIFAAGEGSLLFESSGDTLNFWVEVFLSAIIPAAILLRKSYRQSQTVMFWISLCAIIGVSLNRVNVAGLATLSMTKSFYFPAWTEWAMTIGILSMAGIFYLFCVEHFGLFNGLSKESVGPWLTPSQFDHTDWKKLYFGGQRLGAIQLNSTIFILTAALSFGLASHDAVFGVEEDKTPVQHPRWVDVNKVELVQNIGARFEIAHKAGNPHPVKANATVMMIDGNRDGRYVLFDHERHSARNKDKEGCGLCHHMSKPYNRYSGCSECHSDMYITVDIFNHELHMHG